MTAQNPVRLLLFFLLALAIASPAAIAKSGKGKGSSGPPPFTPPGSGGFTPPGPPFTPPGPPPWVVVSPSCPSHKPKKNNGHGNNRDGVDRSNPGKSKHGLDSDPHEDDENKWFARHGDDDCPESGRKVIEKGNNGHGNNRDGVDVSNPGNSKAGEDSDSTEDDEAFEGYRWWEEGADEEYERRMAAKKMKKKKVEHPEWRRNFPR